jgi:hypothetical protein
MAALATSQLATTHAGFGLGGDTSMFRRGVQGLRGPRASAPGTLSVRTSARAAPRQQSRRAQRGGGRFPSLVVCAAAGMNIVFVGAEMAPWSKTGGLGDVLGGLPPAMAVSTTDHRHLFRLVVSSCCMHLSTDMCVTCPCVGLCRRTGTASWSFPPATTSTRTPGTPASCQRYLTAENTPRHQMKVRSCRHRWDLNFLLCCACRSRWGTGTRR